MPKRTDANQAEIVAALRQAGASVAPTHGLGRGFPDLAVGFRGQNFLLEVKDGMKKPSERKLTPDEERWHQGWRGQVVTVESVPEALAAIGIVPP